jgi:hypothetical protein
MDPTTLTAVFTTLAVFAVWLWLRRGTRRIEQRPDYPFVRMCAATVVVVMMICMSVAWPEMWGPVGIWTWICVTICVVGFMGLAWRRFLTKDHLPENPVNPPGPNQDAPS